MAGCVRQILQIFHGSMGNLKQLATENVYRVHEHVPRRLKQQSPAQPGHAPALPGAPLLSLVDSACASPYFCTKFYSKYN
jgi:hypothetical protein